MGLSMRALLDTHTFLWSLTSLDRIGKSALRTISLQSTEALVSVVSLWELAIKESRGALRFEIPFDELIQSAVETSGFVLLPIKHEHLLRVGSLPFPANGHADPFDRMLVAQALAEGIDLLSADAKLDAYGVRRVW